MTRPYPPAQCVHCGKRVPRAAAHRCPLCRTPFEQALPLDVNEVPRDKA